MEKHCAKLEVGNDILSQALGFGANYEKIWVRLRRVIQYADDLKVIIILVAKVLSCGVFLQGSPARVD